MKPKRLQQRLNQLQNRHYMSEYDSNRNLWDELYSSLKEYLDLRINEGKLSLTESLAVLFGRILVFTLVLFSGALAFGFFAIAFSDWIGTLLNSQALGALITGGIFLLVMTVLLIFRKRLFTDSMVKLIINVMFNNTRKDESAN